MDRGTEKQNTVPKGQKQKKSTSSVGREGGQGVVIISYHVRQGVRRDGSLKLYIGP